MGAGTAARDGALISLLIRFRFHTDPGDPTAGSQKHRTGVTIAASPATPGGDLARRLRARLHAVRLRLAPHGSLQARAARRLYGLLRALPRRLDRLIFPTPEGFPQAYQAWIAQNEPAGMQIFCSRFIRRPGGPIFSFLIDARRAEPAMVAETLRSFNRQTDPRWELWLIAGEGSPEKSGIRRTESRIHDLPPEKPERFQPAGEWIGWISPGDRLAPAALAELAQWIRTRPAADFIYSDEDRITPDGRTRHGHFFKPDWSPDLLRSCNYIHRLAVLRGGLLTPAEILACRGDYDAYLRAAERAGEVAHLPKVLCHVVSDATPGQGKPVWQSPAEDEGAAVLQEHLQRMGFAAEVQPGLLPGSLQYTLSTDPALSVAIIIPNRDQPAVLERCVNSILERSSYPNFEILLVENGSMETETFVVYERLQALDARVHRMDWDGVFNYARINNQAAHRVRSEMLLFLNNDTEVIRPDWIERLLDHARRKPVGAVGAKLLYPDGTVQHAGVIIGIRGIAAHGHKRLERSAPGYNGRAGLVQNFSAVTAACMLVRREVFEQIGGFDEEYAVAYNDVDLCLRLRAAGYWIVWTPYAELFHHEQLTRGHDTAPMERERANAETERMRRLWPHYFQEGDPFYSPHLTLDDEDFSLRLRPIR